MAESTKGGVDGHIEASKNKRISELEGLYHLQHPQMSTTPYPKMALYGTLGGHSGAIKGRC